jgi:hypothetical protein
MTAKTRSRRGAELPDVTKREPSYIMVDEAPSGRRALCGPRLFEEVGEGRLAFEAEQRGLGGHRPSTASLIDLICPTTSQDRLFGPYRSLNERALMSVETSLMTTDMAPRLRIFAFAFLCDSSHQYFDGSILSERPNEKTSRLSS